MQTLQALSNKTLINPNYRRHYQTTVSSCECPSNFHSKYICKHIRLERFIVSTNRRAAQLVAYYRGRGVNDSALKIRLTVLRAELTEAHVVLASPFEVPVQRKEANIKISWLKNQIKQLEKRVAMIERRKPAPAAVVAQNQKPKCEHKRTENRNSFGNRQIRIYCLDCRLIIHSEWSMSC